MLVKIIKENLCHFTFFIISTKHYQVALFQLHQSMLTDDRHLKKMKKLADKENYRPTSILPNLSKVYKKLIYDPMYPVFHQISSKLQYGFRKDVNAEKC